MTVSFIEAVIGDDMQAVDRALRQALDSDVFLIRQVAEHIVGGGGKRLRPALLLLVAGATGYRGSDQHVLAAVVEMIHTATLLHDDVVDESDLRRGHATANAAFGNAASVLVGDFLYSRAFQMMVGVSRMRVLEILADATNAIAEGEVLQLMNAGDADLTETAYIDVIQRKTARLFEAAARLGAVLGGADAPLEDALARYGMHMGTAFQLVDDLLDYSGDATAIGKNLGDDLAEGKMTLPLIRALATGELRRCRGDPACHRRWRNDGFRPGDRRAGGHRCPCLYPHLRRQRGKPRRRLSGRFARLDLPENSARIDSLRSAADVLASRRCHSRRRCPSRRARLAESGYDTTAFPPRVRHVVPIPPREPNRGVA